MTRYDCLTFEFSLFLVTNDYEEMDKSDLNEISRFSVLEKKKVSHVKEDIVSNSSFKEARDIEEMNNSNANDSSW